MGTKKKILAFGLAGVMAVSVMGMGFAAWHTEITASGNISAQAAQSNWNVQITQADLQTSTLGAEIEMDYSGYGLKLVCPETSYGQACNEAAVARKYSSSTKRPGTQSTTYAVSSWLWLIDTTRFDMDQLGKMNTEDRRLAMLSGMEDGSVIRLSDKNTAPDGTEVDPIHAWYYYKNTSDYFGSEAARPTIMNALVEQSDTLVKQLRPDTYHNYVLACVVSDNTQDCPDLQFVIASMKSEDGSESSPVSFTETHAQYANVHFTLPGAWANYTMTIQNNGTASAYLEDTVITLESDQDQLVLEQPDLTGEVLAPGESCTLNFVVKADNNDSNTLDATGTLSIQLPYIQADLATAPEAGHTHNN